MNYKLPIMNYKLIMASLFVAANVNAKVTLPKMFSDGMVMQRETTANVWGNAERSATVKVSPSWTKKTYTAKADSNGKWKVAIETPEAGGPTPSHSMTARRPC